jgi:orotidine-5'-phosphate decarboxylase
MTTFVEKIQKHWNEGKFLCVGLDTDTAKLPDVIKQRSIFIHDRIVDFNKAIISATYDDVVCAFKPNLAFYLKHGAEGISALEATIALSHKIAPDVPVILDGKFGDIGNTNDGYAEFAFEYLKADAVTINPYMGQVAMQTFLDYKDKGIFILCRTSNPGASEFQDLKSETAENMKLPLYQTAARNVLRHWNANGNCGLVVGATHPEELRQVRQIVGDMPLLIPGIGAQGGDLEQTVLTGKNSRNQGMIINAGRSVIYASSGEDFAEAARKEAQRTHDLICQHLYFERPE